MNQRDRLAAALHDALCDASWHHPQDQMDEWKADALLARGVRVLDAETIREAVVRSTLRLPEGIEYELAYMFEVER